MKIEDVFRDDTYVTGLPNMDACKCCGRNEDLRGGICWDCATAETIVANGLDMYDKPVTPLPGYSIHMAKVRAILKQYQKATP